MWVSSRVVKEIFAACVETDMTELWVARLRYSADTDFTILVILRGAICPEESVLPDVAYYVMLLGC